MRVSDILRRKGTGVTTIGPDASIHDAIRVLVEHNIGALVVVDGDEDEVVGIITERDILRECAVRCDELRTRRVREVMTRDVIIAVSDDKVDYVMGIMTKNRVRHLPVMDDADLSGIISIGDVVNAHLREAEFENRLLKDYIHGPC